MAESPAEITDLYEVGETLGTGHFSKVKLGVDRKTGERVAIKIIEKPKQNKMHMLKAEVDILTKADHPNVVKLFKVHETPTVLYLVLELLTGGELFDRIIAKGHYSEADARKVSVTLLESIGYLHSIGIAHRDLKPENILLKDKGEDGAIKVTDFGLSKIFADDAAGEVIMKTACGTPGYVAPEVLAHDAYSSQVDLWSIGVIVYILLCGFPPFYGDNDAQMFKKIKAGQYKFLSPYWDPISADAKDFVSKLLVVDSKKRMTAEEALKHKWIAGDVKHVSTKNLFAALPKGDKPEAEEDEEETTMANMLADFHLDRKADALLKKFNLPPDEVRIKKFACALGYSPGQLHVTSKHLCFVGSLGSTLCVPLSDLVTIAKAKRFKLSPGQGHSLHMTAKDGVVHKFTGFTLREECLTTVVEQAKACGVTVAVE